jgi:hypothetical protein
MDKVYSLDEKSPTPLSEKNAGPIHPKLWAKPGRVYGGPTPALNSSYGRDFKTVYRSPRPRR